MDVYEFSDRTKAGYGWIMQSCDLPPPSPWTRTNEKIEFFFKFIIHSMQNQWSHIDRRVINQFNSSMGWAHREILPFWIIHYDKTRVRSLRQFAGISDENQTCTGTVIGYDTMRRLHKNFKSNDKKFCIRDGKTSVPGAPHYFVVLIPPWQWNHHLRYI